MVNVTATSGKWSAAAAPFRQANPALLHHHTTQVRQCAMLCLLPVQVDSVLLPTCTTNERMTYALVSSGPSG